MNNILNIVDNFYKNFILRDMLSIWIPGVAITILFLSLFPNGLDLQLDDNINKVIKICIYIALFTLSYLVGFVLQSCGQWIGLINPSEKKGREYRKERYKVQIQFFEKNNPVLLNQRERIVVLKQLTGNNAIAGIIAGLIVIIKMAIVNIACWIIVLITISIALFIWALISINHKLEERQEDFENSNIK